MSLLLLWFSIFTIETINFNATCQLIFLFEMKKGRKKENSALCSTFNRHFSVLLSEYISVRVMGTCQTFYRHYCPSLITALQLSVLFHELSARSSRQTITIIKSDINVNTSSGGNSGVSEKKSYLNFLLHTISPTASLSIVLQLWIALYTGITPTQNELSKE
jgi:hypothetical protein